MRAVVRQERRALVERMYREGKPVKEIAATLGVQTNAAQRLIWRMRQEGVDLPHRQPRLRIGSDLGRFPPHVARRGGHRPDPPPCSFCDGDGEVVNPGNADPAVKLTEWLPPVGCPRCGQSGKDPHP